MPYFSDNFKAKLGFLINLTDNSVYINPFIKLTHDESNEEIAYREKKEAYSKSMDLKPTKTPWYKKLSLKIKQWFNR